MATLFIGVWLGVTLPLILSTVFSALKPLVMKDSTGISMIIIAIIVGICDTYIGYKIFEKRIQPWFKNRK